MTVKLKDNKEEVLFRMQSRIKMVNRDLLTDIRRNANPNTPLKDDFLRRNVLQTVSGKKGIIVWREPYAQYQERGERADGTRVIKHYTTPGTGKDFAKNAVKKVITSKNIVAKFQKFQ